MGFYHSSNRSRPRPQQGKEKRYRRQPHVELADETVIQICRDLQEIRHRYGNRLNDEDYRDNRQWERNTFQWLMRYMVRLSSSSE
jgi:hypothetical protein